MSSSKPITNQPDAPAEVPVPKASDLAAMAPVTASAAGYQGNWRGLSASGFDSTIAAA